MKRLLILCALFFIGMGGALAQSGEVALGVKGGNSALFGSFAAISVEADCEVVEDFSLRGGAQYNTIGRTAAEIRPSYLHDFKFGRLSGEVLFNYTNQNRMNHYAIGCGVSLDIPGLWVTLGYYHRTTTLGADKLYEPFNIYYELGVRCLPKIEHWDLNIIITNSEIFELERHYQPSFALEGWWYPLEKLGVQLGVNYKPAGMFNISSDYYQIYGNVGVCYRW